VVSWGDDLSDPRDKLLGLIEEFDTAMLVTTAAAAPPHARPMSIATVDPSSVFWFFSARDADLVHEVERDPRCTITMQGRRRFVALRGEAHVVEDVGKIRALWSERLRPWFPMGPSSPRISLIRFLPSEGEYWDVSGVEALRYAFRAGSAFLRGRRMDDDCRRHATVSL
jgi:general stress protein 26